MTKKHNAAGVRALFTLSLCLLLAMTALALPARAADVDIMFNDPGAIVGNGVTVNVYTTGDVAGVSLTIVYDTDYLSYTGFSGGLGNASVQDSGGTITIVDYHSTAAAKFSLDLSFTTRAVGSTTLRPTACTVSDASGDLMSVEFASHSSVVNITSASSDCSLSALYIDPGTLSPAFSSGTTSYTVTVPNTTTWLAVSPVKSDASASYSISGNDWLNVGLNYVTVTVTAGNGAQRTYTLAVTRQAAEQTAAPADNTVDTSPEEEPVYAAAPDGTQLEIVSFSAGQIPDGFAGIELSYKGKNIAAIRSSDGKRTAVYCRGGSSWGEGFYILDATAGSVTPMNILTVEGGSWVILDAALSSADPPANCRIGEKELDGKTYTVFLPETDGEYLIFYGVGPSGTTGLYRYDTGEKTIQRYGLSPEEMTDSRWTILDPTAANVETPAGYVLTEVIVDGASCRGFVPASGEASAYFVLYAQRDGETPGLYTYDIGQKTFQRFGILKAVDEGGPAETGESPEETDEALARAERTLRTCRWILAAVSLMLLAALTVVAVLAVLLRRRGRK